MKVNEIKGYDLERINELYAEFVKTNGDNGDYDFVEDFIDRCECCGVLHFHDDLEEKELWNGKILKCCEKCRNVIDEDKNVDEINEL